MIYTISLVLYYCILFLRKELFRYPQIGDISFYWYHFCNLVFHPPFSITALIRSDDIFFLSGFLTFYLSRWTGRIFRLSSILSITSSSITVHFSLLRSSSSGSFLSPEISLDLFLLQQLFGWFPPFSWWWHVWTGMLPSSHWHWLCLCLRLPYYESLKQQTALKSHQLALRNSQNTITQLTRSICFFHEIFLASEILWNVQLSHRFNYIMKYDLNIL